jgi:hypothetical protein
VGSWFLLSVIVLSRKKRPIALTLIPKDGPVLSTTELYLLQTELQLNPILTNSNPAFHLIFHLQTGKPVRFGSVESK